MNQQIVDKIRQCPSLPSLPAIAIQVLDLAQREEIDVEQIAHVITHDPAITLKILRTVNSTFYCPGQNISNITQALVVMGVQAVKSLVLGFSLVRNLSQKRTSGFDPVAYWRRSIYSATAARVLAAKLDIIQQEECFLAALLQDIGMLVLDQVLGDEYGAVHSGASSPEQLLQREKEALGMTHADVSGLMAEQWSLPPILAVPMQFHHTLDEVEDEALRGLVNVVAAANACAEIFMCESAPAGDSVADRIARARAFCGQALGISEPDCNALLDEICQRTRETAKLFDIELGDVTFDQIMGRAQDALRKLAEAASTQHCIVA